MSCPTHNLRDAVIQKMFQDFGEPEVAKTTCFGYDDLVIKLMANDRIRITIIKDSLSNFKGQDTWVLSFKDYLNLTDVAQKCMCIRSKIPNVI